MNKLITILLLSFSTAFFAQETIRFEQSDFKTVLAKAKQEKKLVFMDAFAVWCGPCKLMEKNVFTQPAVREYYNANFINARFDMEKGEGRDIALKYGIRSYPSFLFLNGDGEVVMQSYGYMDEENFLAFAKEASNPALAGGSMKDAFEKGEKDPAFLLNMMRMYAQSDYELAKKASERYFKGKGNADLTRDEIGMLLYFLKSPADANYAVFKNKKANISEVMSVDIYKQFDVNIKISSVMEAALNQSTGIINDAEFYEHAVPLVGRAEAETALNRMKVIYYPGVGNYKEFEIAALQYYKNSEEFHPEELLKAAAIFSEHITAKASLKKAQEWAEKAVMKGESPDNTYILATLYAKTGNTTGARMYAEVSQRLAQQQGKDATAAAQLLKRLN